MQNLRPEIAKKVKEIIRVKAKVAYELDRHMTTVERMVDSGDPLLTIPGVVKVIAEELEITADQVLTEE